MQCVLYLLLFTVSFYEFFFLAPTHNWKTPSPRPTRFTIISLRYYQRPGGLGPMRGLRLSREQAISRHSLLKCQLLLSRAHGLEPLTAAPVEENASWEKSFPKRLSNVTTTEKGGAIVEMHTMRDRGRTSRTGAGPTTSQEEE